ncbi:hypothetical protein TRVL_03503 [Trypanosoma vivax]|uniref:Uncharacterized protein n=1 Tax=Trypanosoma vivax (strain Y486) TaxID=1055687 RepID=G0U3C4_TRYVY|nr:hypothetical protein TRVL_03503 [Trypanosoma vivax]CCC50780.1 conserved hypothetical protein [Trypanosoma vivax Y486]
MQRGSFLIITPPRVIVAAMGCWLLLAYQKWRRLPLFQSKKEASKYGEGNVRRVLSESALSLLPVRVLVDRLSPGWSAQPPIFCPPHLAIVPLQQATRIANSCRLIEGDCFVTCEGPIASLLWSDPEETDVSSFLLEYMRCTPYMVPIANSGAVIMTLHDAGFVCDTTCFSHVVVDEHEQVAVALGRNGPYVLALVAMPYLSSPPAQSDHDTDEEHNFPLTVSHFTPSDLQCLLKACLPVPVADGVLLPGTPSGSQKGCLRITCSDGDCSLTFVAQLPLVVRCAENGENFLFALEGIPLPGGLIVLDSTTVQSIANGTAIDDLFPRKCHKHPPVSSLFRLIYMERRAHDNGDSTTHVSCTHGSEPNFQVVDLPTKAGDVSVVCCHPNIGIHFPISTRNGVVHEPVLTDDLILMYYPLGDEKSFKPSQVFEGSSAAPPLFTVRRLATLPSTWETSPGTEEALIHNVRIHFTDWAREKIPSTVCDISGFRCVQLSEEKEGRFCRTYVVPMGGALTVLRWETQTRELEMHLPLLYSFLDTLHLENPQV